MTSLYCRKWFKKRSRGWSSCWKWLDQTKPTVLCSVHVSNCCVWHSFKAIHYHIHRYYSVSENV